MKFKLKSSKFGLVYKEDGEEEGRKRYQTVVFEVEEEGRIELRTNDEDSLPEVIFISSKHPEVPERKLIGTQKIFDEREMWTLNGGLDTGVKFATIANPIVGIIRIIFGAVGADGGTG